MIWSDLMVPGVPVIEKIIRALLVYVALTVLLRVLCRRGKRGLLRDRSRTPGGKPGHCGAGWTLLG